MTQTLLSFGHGYSAQALGKALLAQGWRVIGTTRNQEKAHEFKKTGIEPLLWPHGDLISALDEADHILISAGPDKDGDPTLPVLRDEISKRAKQFAWVGYLSTTGVYGDHDGGWVDESTPISPSTKRGIARQQAENDWLSIPDLPLHIFRLAGIYGPERGPFAKLRNGTARRIIKKNQVFSRIHVDDIAQVLEASINSPNAGAIYNLCDDDPAPPQDVIAYAAKLLNMPLPPEVPFETAQMSPMARSFYSDSKKVRNDRIKNELGVQLKYPTYAAALQAMLDAERKM